MTDRRTEILDAALRVLAEHGMRGLTHRAVDAAAGIAPGSTSYYFRSRSALVEGCVAPAGGDRPGGGGAGGGGRAVHATSSTRLVAVAVAMATTGRHRTLARYELSVAGAREPHLRAALVVGGDAIRALAARTLAAAGRRRPRRGGRRARRPAGRVGLHGAGPRPPRPRRPRRLGASPARARPAQLDRPPNAESPFS